MGGNLAMSRVENRPSGVSLAAAADEAFATSPQSGLAWRCFRLRPEPPTDPDVNLSIHPARATLKKAAAFIKQGVAESARGISPRAAHRTVRKSLDLHGSCHRLKTAVFRQD
jgi:hypothetical protein